MEAYLLNDPIIVYQSFATRKQSSVAYLPSLVASEADNVIIETIKHAEDGDGIIIRLYESQRKRGQVHIRFGGAIDSAWMTNLLEENGSALVIENDSICLDIKPFQIVTIKIQPKSK